MKKLLVLFVIVALSGMFLSGCSDTKAEIPDGCDEFVYLCYYSYAPDAITLVACGVEMGLIAYCESGQTCGANSIVEETAKGTSYIRENLCEDDPNPLPSCSDSDDGKDYNTKGYVEGIKDGAEYKWEDTCSYSTLYEYSCDGNSPHVEDLTCENGCEDGACITDDPDPDCTTDADCPKPLCMGITSQCINGECETFGTCAECTEDSNCNDDDNETTDKCVDGKCSNIVPTKTNLWLAVGIPAGALLIIAGILFFIFKPKKKKR